MCHVCASHVNLTLFLGSCLKSSCAAINSAVRKQKPDHHLGFAKAFVSLPRSPTEQIQVAGWREVSSERFILRASLLFQLMNLAFVPLV